MDITSQGSDWPEDFKAIISCLTGEISKLSSENGELKTKLTEKDQIVGKVVEQNDLAHQLEAAKQEVVELKSKLEKKEQTVDKAVEQLANLSRKFDESQKEVAELKDQVSESNERASKAAEKNDDLAHQLEAAKQETGELKSKLAQTQRDKKAIEDHLGQAYNDNINKLNAEFANLTQTFEMKCQESQELANQIRESNDQCNEIVGDLHKQGLEKFNNGQYQESLELYSKAIGIEETGRKDSCWLGLLWNNVSTSWSGLKRYEKSLEAIEKAIEHYPSHALFYYNRGNYHKKLGHNEQAVAYYKKSLAINPNYSSAKAELVKLEKK